MNQNTTIILWVVGALIVGGIVGWWIGLAMAVPTQVTNTTSSSNTATNTTASGGHSIKAHDFMVTMDKLWEDHITWTRLYIVSAVNKLPDADATLARLMKNQEDLGNAIKPYYGENAGNQLTALLKIHISLAGKIVADALSNNTTAVTNDQTQWKDNANQIADFLSQANPTNWPQADVRKMMQDHLTLTTQEAVDIIGKKSQASIDDYDKVKDEILTMSQTLSQGIVNQFPDKF